MIVPGIKCDGCGKMKDANRWLLGTIAAATISLGKSEETYVDSVALFPWVEHTFDLSIKDFCSDQCALKWQAAELDKLGR